jgi:hypothetical protein
MRWLGSLLGDGDADHRRWTYEELNGKPQIRDCADSRMFSYESGRFKLSQLFEARECPTTATTSLSFRRRL